MYNCTDLSCVLHHHHFYAHLHHLKRHLDDHHDQHQDDEGKRFKIIHFPIKSIDEIAATRKTWKRSLTVHVVGCIRNLLDLCHKCHFWVLHIKWHLTAITRKRRQRQRALHRTNSRSNSAHKQHTKKGARKNSKVEKSFIIQYTCWLVFVRFTYSKIRSCDGYTLITSNDVCNFSLVTFSNTAAALEYQLSPKWQRGKTHSMLSRWFDFNWALIKA